MSETERPSEQSEAMALQLHAIRGALLGWFRRRVPDPSEAEDLVQECFLRIIQRADQAALVHFQAYVYQTAGSVLADRRRRRGVRRADDHVALEPAHYDSQEADALRTALGKERLRQVSKVLMTLPERTRTVFVLRRVEGMRYGEIATRLRISVSAVEKHMVRAIDRLLLNEEDAT